MVKKVAAQGKKMTLKGWQSQASSKNFPQAHHGPVQGLLLLCLLSPQEISCSATALGLHFPSNVGEVATLGWFC